METVINWHSVAESLPEEGERVLIATPSKVSIGIMEGMLSGDPATPAFTDHHWMTIGVTYWAKLPPLPQPTVVDQ